MADDEGRSERLLYVKHLAVTLSGSAGLLLPFNSEPPEVVRPLRQVLPAVVFDDLTDERLNEDACTRRRADYVVRKGLTPARRTHREDHMFFRQQIFPSDGTYCYAAAFSSAPR